jgi:hypothetical protein
MLVNRKKSQKLARRIGAQPNICWANALAGMKYLWFARYVEGIAVIVKPGHVEYSPHGWLERFSEIIELTPEWLGPDQTTLYFPIRTYRAREIREHTMGLPILSLDAPEWNDCYEIVKHFVRALQ